MTRLVAAAVALGLAVLSAGVALAAPSGWLALDGGVRSAGVSRDRGTESAGAISCPPAAVDVAGTHAPDAVAECFTLAASLSEPSLRDAGGPPSEVTQAAAAPGPAREPWLAIGVSLFSLLGLLGVCDLLRWVARRETRGRPRDVRRE